MRRLFDSTTKIFLWLTLTLNYYMAFRILSGWESGLGGAAELMAVMFVSIDAIVAMYLWKAKNENVIKLAQQVKDCGLSEQEIARAINLATRTASEEDDQ